MSDLSRTPQSKTADQILGHPRFAEARRLHCRMQYELLGDHTMNRMCMSTARNILFGSIISLYAGYEPHDRDTWPTLKHLKLMVGRFQQCGDRMVDDFVARLKHLGYVEDVAAPDDGRVKLLRPTEIMLRQDRRYNVMMFAPLELLYPGGGYRAAIELDPAFHLAFRRIGLEVTKRAATIVSNNGRLFRHFARDAGAGVIFWISNGTPSGEGGVVVSLSEMADTFRVSRTHIRSIVRGLEEDELIEVREEGLHRRITPLPPFITAFDSLVADLLAQHDLMAQLVAAQVK